MTQHVDEPRNPYRVPGHASQAAEPVQVLRLDTARRADGTFDETFLAGLRTALHEIGFLQLTDYGGRSGDKERPIGCAHADERMLLVQIVMR
jgi:hypothetical protein